MNQKEISLESFISSCDDMLIAQEGLGGVAIKKSIKLLIQKLLKLWIWFVDRIKTIKKRKANNSKEAKEKSKEQDEEVKKFMRTYEVAVDNLSEITSELLTKKIISTLSVIGVRLNKDDPSYVDSLIADFDKECKNMIFCKNELVSDTNDLTFDINGMRKLYMEYIDIKEYLNDNRLLVQYITNQSLEINLSFLYTRLEMLKSKAEKTYKEFERGNIVELPPKLMNYIHTNYNQTITDIATLTNEYLFLLNIISA